MSYIWVCGVLLGLGRVGERHSLFLPGELGKFPCSCLVCICVGIFHVWSQMHTGTTHINIKNYPSPPPPPVVQICSNNKNKINSQIIPTYFSVFLVNLGNEQQQGNKPFIF